MAGQRCRTQIGFAVAALAVHAAGQEVAVAPKTDAPRTAIERHLQALADPDPAARHAAMLALWSAGPPAVPMLAAAVQRDDAGSSAALRVLWQLGGEAAPAAPVLRRLLAKAKDPRRNELAQTIARIEGPTCILVSRHAANEIVQLDFDGKTVRTVTCPSPWGVWPLPDDRLAVIVFNEGAVRRLDWAGETVGNDAVVSSLTSFMPLEDGGNISTNWNNNGLLTRRDAGGAVRWSHQNDAFRAMRFLDGVLAVTRKSPRLVHYSLDGEELAAVKLPTACCGLWPLPNGNTMLSAQSGQVLEVTANGEVVSKFEVTGHANDVARLRDGRTVVSAATGVYLFGADGKMLWHRGELGQCGPMFVRVPW